MVWDKWIMKTNSQPNIQLVNLWKSRSIPIKTIADLGRLLYADAMLAKQRTSHTDYGTRLRRTIDEITCNEESYGPNTNYFRETIKCLVSGRNIGRREHGANTEDYVSGIIFDRMKKLQPYMEIADDSELNEIINSDDKGAIVRLFKASNPSPTITRLGFIRGGLGLIATILPVALAGFNPTSTNDGQTHGGNPYKTISLANQHKIDKIKSDPHFLEDYGFSSEFCDDISNSLIEGSYKYDNTISSIIATKIVATIKRVHKPDRVVQIKDERIELYDPNTDDDSPRGAYATNSELQMGVKYIYEDGNDELHEEYYCLEHDYEHPSIGMDNAGRALTIMNDDPDTALNLALSFAISHFTPTQTTEKELIFSNPNSGAHHFKTYGKFELGERWRKANGEPLDCD